MIRVLQMTAFVVLMSFVRPSGVELKGTVSDEATGKPIPGAYVYTVSGEEEALSDKQGRFKFTTWKTLPVTLTVQHTNYRKKTVTVTGSSTQLEIRMKRSD